MSVRTANGFVLLVALGGVVGVLYLAGCFALKISAAHTAALLKDSEPSWRSVTCRPYKGGYWNYTCRVDSRLAGRFSFEVKVNGSGITDQSAP